MALLFIGQNICLCSKFLTFFPVIFIKTSSRLSKQVSVKDRKTKDKLIA